MLVLIPLINKQAKNVLILLLLSIPSIFFILSDFVSDLFCAEVVSVADGVHHLSMIIGERLVQKFDHSGSRI